MGKIGSTPILPEESEEPGVAWVPESTGVNSVTGAPESIGLPTADGNGSTTGPAAGVSE